MRCKLREGVYLRRIGPNYALLALRGVPCPPIVPLDALGVVYVRLLDEGWTTEEMAAWIAREKHIDAAAMLPRLTAVRDMLMKCGCAVESE